MKRTRKELERDLNAAIERVRTFDSIVMQRDALLRQVGSMHRCQKLLVAVVVEMKEAFTPSDREIERLESSMKQAFGAMTEAGYEER